MNRQVLKTIRKKLRNKYIYFCAGKSPCAVPGHGGKMSRIKNFFKKHVIFSALILTAAIMLLYNYGGYYLPVGSTKNQVLSPVLSLYKFFLAFLVMLYLKIFDFASLKVLWFRHTKKALIIFFPVSIIVAIEFLVSFIASYKNVTLPDFLLFIFGLLAIGIFEEFLFRVGVLQIFLSKWHSSKKDLEKAAAGSGILFGLVHLTNIIGGNASLYVFGQCVMAAALGYLFSIIYIITKNVWGCVFFHAVFDSVSTYNLLFGQEKVSQSVSTIQYSLNNASDDTLKQVLLVAGFYLIVILFTAALIFTGRKLLTMSEEIAAAKEKTKTDIFLMKLLKIEDYPS